MIDVVKVASYIFNRYMDELNAKIDEMKLHKLLYFSQREAIIETGEPMFHAQFVAWKYGPVILEIRDKYRTDALNVMPEKGELIPFKDSLDYVFANYSKKDSWTLSMLTHGESCWQKAREGYGKDEHCDVLIRVEDIRKDAERMKMRRFFFEEVVPNLRMNLH